MGKSYKAQLSEFKDFRRDPEKFKRIYPKSHKLKPYKITGIITNFGLLTDKEIIIGRYATPRDVEKAIKAAEKSGMYSKIICDPPIKDEQV